MNGTETFQPISILEHNGVIVSDYRGIANLLAITFSSVSNNSNYPDSFQSIKSRVEMLP